MNSRSNCNNLHDGCYFCSKHARTRTRLISDKVNRSIPQLRS